MKKVTAAEFVDLVKSDKDLYDRFKAALQKADDRTAVEVAGDLGYQIEMPEIQALDDDLLTSVAGGAGNNYYGADVIDLDKLFPIGFNNSSTGLDLGCQVKR